MRKRSLRCSDFSHVNGLPEDEAKSPSVRLRTRVRVPSRRSASLSRHYTNRQSEATGVLRTAHLEVLIEDYLADCATAHSARTLEKRRWYLVRLIAFLKEHDHEICDERELKQYFGSLTNLHTGEELRPATFDTMRRDTLTFWNWLVRKKYTRTNPVEAIMRPKVPEDLVPPLSEEQIQDLVATARRSFFAPRDTAIILFFLDTAVRTSELCKLRICDVDFKHKAATIHYGKGKKKRTVFFTTRTLTALYCYLEGRLPEDHEINPDKLVCLNEPIFLAETGKCIGEPLTRRGMYQLVERLIIKAGIRGTKKGAHLLRHTWTYHFFRAGGTEKAAMLLLGHTDNKTTHKYNNMATADLFAASQRGSVVEKLRL